MACPLPSLFTRACIAVLIGDTLTRAWASSACTSDGTGTTVDGLHSRWLPAYSSPSAFDEDPASEMYMSTCKEYGIQPNTDVLNRLQLGIGDIVIMPTEKDSFGDLSLRALVKLLLYGEGEKFHNVHKLDVSRCRLGPSSMFLIASLIRHPSSCLRTLDVSYQDVGYEGFSALASAIRVTGTMTRLLMHQAGLGDEGGQVLAELLRNSSSTEFREIDVQNNFIAPPTCTELVDLASERHIKLWLGGNRVADEICNAVTHLFGEIFAAIGTVFMCRRLSKKPAYYFAPAAIYCASMNVLFISSTLFHAFFALGEETVYIFSILDYSGIFFLIAGSYSPFLGILFHNEFWARALLTGMWVVAVAGIMTAAFYTGPGQTPLRLTLFLTMGWSTMVCIHRIAQKIGRDGMLLMVGGGILYTAGVPWFVRNRHTMGFPDHAIWHIFVVLASLCHYCCIFFFVLDYSEKRVHSSVEIEGVDKEALMRTFSANSLNSLSSEEEA
mmetsp:Transcript_118978/g.379397  ORF Transcript_118978/g.379397 Transcript_118978/m.379397 type:complete len:497 (-) Transcript_118978:175-1665(-)